MPRGHRYANAQQKNGNYAEENNIFQGIEEVCSLGLVESIQEPSSAHASCATATRSISPSAMPKTKFQPKPLCRYCLFGRMNFIW